MVARYALAFKVAFRGIAAQETRGAIPREHTPIGRAQVELCVQPCGLKVLAEAS